MLIDVHAHFYHDRTPYPDWRERNTRRLDVGTRLGITYHVASILGSWGRFSPTYFPSPTDVSYGNDQMLALVDAHPDRVRAYVTVNPNFTAHAMTEIERCLDRGAVGVKLAASRRCTDPLLDPIAEAAATRGVPILHHVWQHRRRDWPGQEASDGAELCTLARRHARTQFILAHLGGGGDWQHSLAAAADRPNVWIDLSGSGVDAGMLESAISTVGTSRLLWGADLTLDTGWAKLRYLERIGLNAAELEAVSWRNAATIFPPGTFDAR